MRSIESEGDTIDEAIERALTALEVGRDQVEVDIVTDATKGVFGFGGKQARVRATVRAPFVPSLDGEPAPSRDDSRETFSRPARDPALRTPSAAAQESAPPDAFMARSQAVLHE